MSINDCFRNVLDFHYMGFDKMEAFQHNFSLSLSWCLRRYVHTSNIYRWCHLCVCVWVFMRKHLPNTTIFEEDFFCCCSIRCMEDGGVVVAFFWLNIWRERCPTTMCIVYSVLTKANFNQYKPFLMSFVESFLVGTKYIYLVSITYKHTHENKLQPNYIYIYACACMCVRILKRL